MEPINQIEEQLERTKLELNLLYEISNAMRTTLKLDEILYIILTGVTAHVALGFNRAALFLVNDTEGLIEGKMGIGPESGEEANRIWTQIEAEKMDLEDLISAPRVPLVFESHFNRQIQHLKVPLNEKTDSLLSMVSQESMPIHLTKETIKDYKNTPIVQLLKSEELLLIPLKAKDRVNGIIVADNFVTKKLISKDDVRMLTMFANQAGLAIENSQLYEKTVLQSNMDSLTQLWNHGYFQFLLQEEIEKAKVTKGFMSLIIMDIDDFKIHNDALGHQAGDRILKELALLLKNRSRKMDQVCRYGGEEFTIILPNTEINESCNIAERLRESIKKHSFLREEENLLRKNLTVSFGVSSFPKDGSTPSELITSCDKALYQAKHRGKDNTYYHL